MAHAREIILGSKESFQVPGPSGEMYPGALRLSPGSLSALVRRADVASIYDAGHGWVWVRDIFRLRVNGPEQTIWLDGLK